VLVELQDSEKVSGISPAISRLYLITVISAGSCESDDNGSP